MLNYQERIFLKGDGNRYWERNHEALQAKERMQYDPVLRILQKQRIKPKNVLDIGCSNGWRCQAIYQRYRSACTGIDPSRKALQIGRNLYSAIQFRQGVVERLPVSTTKLFDLVVVYYVLHWVSRDALLKSIAEIDRVVADNGYLVIGDFYPAEPARVPYHHLPGKSVFTYKLDYAHLFIASGRYRQLAVQVLEHATEKPVLKTPPQRRGSCVLMQKSRDGFYNLQSSGKRR